jgi:hypothetical protein
MHNAKRKSAVYMQPRNTELKDYPLWLRNPTIDEAIEIAWERGC